MTTNHSPRTIACKSQVVFDSVWGACPGEWPWYKDFTFDEDDRTITVTMETGADVPDFAVPEYRTATLTVTALRRAIDALAALYPKGVGGHLAREFATGDPDIDAGDADCIIQYAVLGDIVFG